MLRTSAVLLDGLKFCTKRFCSRLRDRTSKGRQHSAEIQTPRGHRDDVSVWMDSMDNGGTSWKCKQCSEPEIANSVPQPVASWNKPSLVTWHVTMMMLATCPNSVHFNDLDFFSDCFVSYRPLTSMVGGPAVHTIHGMCLDPEPYFDAILFPRVFQNA